MYVFKPIEQSNATEEVLTQLKEAIHQGAFKKGEKLPSEKELTNLFGVSRGVVREAIRGLQVCGYIERRQGPLGGAFIKTHSVGLLGISFSDLYSSKKLSISEVGRTRQYIEPEIARLAALNITDEYREKLEIALAQESLPFESVDDLLIKRTAIHFILAEICGSVILKNILIALISLTHQIIKAKLKENLLSLHRAGEHDAIFMAIVAGDPETAQKTMGRHSASFCSAFIQLEKVNSTVYS